MSQNSKIQGKPRETPCIERPLIVIPARMGSSRLPGKPLADICGLPMIVRVMHRAQSANIGPVIIACSESDVFDAVSAAGGHAVMTDPDLASGTDRVRVAANIFDPKQHFDGIINVQGDLPTLPPHFIQTVLEVLNAHPDCDIATLAVPTDDPYQKSDPNSVKAVLSFAPNENSMARALYFTRANAPTGDGPIWHHIGLYGFARSALNQFCALGPSPLELRERLEQLRALEAGMQVYAGIVDQCPHSVDTPEDLAQVITQIKADKISG